MPQQLQVMWFLPQPLLVLAGQLPGATPVRAIATHSSDEQYEALVRGRADVVVTAMDNVIGWNRRAGPRDFRVVAQVEGTTPLWLIAAPGRKTLNDLRGASLLVDSVKNGFVVALKAMLKQAGLDPISCRYISLGGVTERYQALLAGRGDATLLGGALAGIALASGFEQVAGVQQACPGFPGQGLVIRRSNPAREQIGMWLRELDQARRRTQDLNSLHPSVEGVAMLVEQRRLLDLPGGEDTYADIVETTLINQYLEKEP